MWLIRQLSAHCQIRIQTSWSPLSGTRRTTRYWVLSLASRLYTTSLFHSMPPTTKTTDKSPPVNVKLLLIGNSSVGKSSLLLRFSDEQWLPEDEASATIGVDFRVRWATYFGSKCQLTWENRYTRWKSREGRSRWVYGWVCAPLARLS